MKSRFSESWDQRLRSAEKELLCGLAVGPKSWALVRWKDLPADAQRRLVCSMRSMFELGRECERALAYSRTRSSSARNGE